LHFNIVRQCSLLSANVCAAISQVLLFYCKVAEAFYGGQGGPNDPGEYIVVRNYSGIYSYFMWRVGVCLYLQHCFSFSERTERLSAVNGNRAAGLLDIWHGCVYTRVTSRRICQQLIDIW